MYPNPLVADLMASGIANRIALLHDHRIEPNAEILNALARLEQELDDLAAAVSRAVEFLRGESLAQLRA